MVPQSNLPYYLQLNYIDMAARTVWIHHQSQYNLIGTDHYSSIAKIYSNEVANLPMSTDQCSIPFFNWVSSDFANLCYHVQEIDANSNFFSSSDLRVNSTLLSSE